MKRAPFKVTPVKIAYLTGGKQDKLPTQSLQKHALFLGPKNPQTMSMTLAKNARKTDTHF